MAYGARPVSEQQKYNEGTPMVRIQHGYVCADAIKSVALAAKGVEGIKGIYMGEGSIDALTGATSSHGTFRVLAQAVLEQARQGDSSIVFVDTAH